MKVLVVPFLRAQIQNSSDMDSFLCNKLQSSSPQVLQFQSKRMLRGSAAVQVIWVLGGRGKSHFVIVLCSGALTGVLVGQKSVVSVITLAVWWHCK